MTLLDTGRAIGAVTRLIRDHLKTRISTISALPSFEVIVGRPEPPKSDGDGGPRLNVFLYEAHFDQFLKNRSVYEGMSPPVWLVLKYLLTAFDNGGDSDSPEAHDLIGQAIQALQGLSYLPLTGSTAAHLKDNPEMLKITFNESPPDLLNKLMFGSDMKYRFSVCFEVRPIMIAAEEPTSYSLLVGVDYTQDPAIEVGAKGIQIPTLPSLGPSISGISPSSFEIDSEIELHGENLNLSGLTVLFDSIELPIVQSGATGIKCKIDKMVVSPTTLSAGIHTVSVVQSLPSGKRRSSNISLVRLLPRLINALPKDLTRTNAIDPDSTIIGKIEINGSFVGNAHDDIFVGLYQDGKTVKVFGESSITPSSPADSPQTQLTLEIRKEDDIKQGTYLIILRVNEEQARNSPSVVLVV